MNDAAACLTTMVQYRRVLCMLICFAGLFAATPKSAAHGPLPPKENAVATPLNTTTSTATARTMALYVSPSGNDSWSGFLAQPNASRTDGPKASLAGAVQAARKNAGDKAIYIRDGDYYIHHSIQLMDVDNGLTISAAPGEHPILYGGIDLSRAAWSLGKNGVWHAKVNRRLLPQGILDLYVDGDSQAPARYPNSDTHDLKSGWLIAQNGTNKDHLVFRKGDLPHLDARQLQVIVYDKDQWSTSLIKVRTIDYDNNILYLADNVPWFEPGAGSRYFVMNSSTALDSIGEWYYDGAHGVIYYKPSDSTIFDGSHKITASTTERLIDIRNATHISITQLTIRNASAHASKKHQDLGIGAGSIRVSNSEEVKIRNNMIHHVGVAINAQDVRRILISDNFISDTAGTAIYLGKSWGGRGSEDNVIFNNQIFDVGKTFVDAAGILYQGSSNARIANNLIENSAQFGIYGMQVRPDAQDANHNNIIEYNIVKNPNLSTADGGGIKLISACQNDSQDTIIRYNWIDGVTHLMNRLDGSWFAADDWSPLQWPQPFAAAIYLDWYARGAIVHGNIISNSYGGIAIINGSDNVIESNIVYEGYGPAFLVDNRAIDNPGRPAMTGNVFAWNIALRNDPSAIAVSIRDLDKGYKAAAFHNNLYFGAAIDEDAFVIVGPRSDGTKMMEIRTWLNAPYDIHDERMADPLLAAPRSLDFRLLSDSPALKMGIPQPDHGLLKLIDRHFSGTSDIQLSK